MTQRALLVFNPHAGLHGRGCSPDALAAAMEGWGWSVEREPTDAGRTVARVRAAVARGCDPVVVAGGDGTLNLVINGLAESPATLGVIPCGSANDFARSIGLPMDPDAALAVVRAGATERLDLGWVNGRYFLNAASLGMSAEIAQGLSAARKRRWGRWAYLVEVVSRLHQRRTVPLKVCFEGQCETLETYQVTIANGCCFGGGFRVTSEASFDDGLLDVVLVEPGVRNLAKGVAAPGQSLLERIGSRNYRVERLSVVGAGREVLNIDGEVVVLRSPLNFKVVPRSLTVCTGRP